MEKYFNKTKKKNFFFSIICATLGKENKIENLCQSLNAQNYKNFELIVCDQNNQNFNKKKIKKFNKLKIKFLKSKIGLSTSRNIGIKKSKGDYLIFLDDDIYLNKNFLKKINYLINICNVEVISYKVVDKKNKALLNYPKSNCFIKHPNQIFEFISSVSFVIKKKKNLFFDEKIGLGSKYLFKSGEETDFLIRAVKKFKYKIFYTSSIKIVHDEKKISFLKLIKKHFFYGCGWAFVVRKQKLNISFIIRSILKININIIYHILNLNLLKMSLAISTLVGRIYGLKK